MDKSFLHFLLGSAIFVAAVLVLFPSQDVAIKSELPIIGQISPRTITAQISFDVPKTAQELSEDRKKAIDKIYPIFQYNEEITQKLKDDFNLMMNDIERYKKLQDEISINENANHNKINEAGELYQKLVRKISSTALNQVVQNQRAADTLKYIFKTILENGISNTLIAARPKDVSLFEESYNIRSAKHILYSRGEILLVKDGKDTLVETSSIRPKEFVIDAVLDKYKGSFKIQTGMQSAFYEILYVFIAPNVFYLDAETDRRKADAVSQVNPSKGMVPRGMDIIAAGTIVSKDAMEKLDAMQNALKNDSNQVVQTAFYGQYIVLLLLSVALCLYVWYFRVDKTVKNLQIWAIVVITVIQMILFRLVHNFSDFFHIENLNAIWFYPFAFAPVLISVLFPLRTAGALAVWTSVLFGIFAGYDLAMSVSAYLISFTMALIVNRIRYRVRFMQSLLAGFGIFAVSLVEILLLRNGISWDAYWQNLLLGTANLLISVTFISVFCSVFERVFQITTNLKLAELSDFNHPLLRRLSEYAPGTFDHSIQVGNLGELAGKRIGANTLLIRVMALYHDIGKTMRPEYFTENQRFNYNPHDNLSPFDSVKILRSHILRGVELAKEFNLPPEVIAGIMQHHGRSAAMYFYAKAKEMYPERDIIYSDFCYPGPIPQSKEAAVLMIADTIEAISRSMKISSPEQLNELVFNTINGKLQYDQLNDSGLTMSDIKKLEEGFMIGLEGSAHSRIQYPGSIFDMKKKEGKNVEMGVH